MSRPSPAILLRDFRKQGEMTDAKLIYEASGTSGMAHKHCFNVFEDRGEDRAEEIGRVWLTNSNQIEISLVDPKRHGHHAEWMVQHLIETVRTGPFYALVDPRDEVMNQVCIDFGGKRMNHYTINPLLYDEDEVYPAELELAPQQPAA